MLKVNSATVLLTFRRIPAPTNSLSPSLVFSNVTLQRTGNEPVIGFKSVGGVTECQVGTSAQKRKV